MGLWAQRLCCRVAVWLWAGHLGFLYRGLLSVPLPHYCARVSWGQQGPGGDSEQ